MSPHLENCAPELGLLVETGLSDNFSTTSSVFALRLPSDPPPPSACRLFVFLCDHCLPFSFFRVYVGPVSPHIENSASVAFSLLQHEAARIPVYAFASPFPEVSRSAAVLPALHHAGGFLPAPLPALHVPHVSTTLNDHSLHHSMLFCVLGTLTATHLTEGARPTTNNFPESLKLAPPLPGREPIASSPLSGCLLQKIPWLQPHFPFPWISFSSRSSPQRNACSSTARSR